MCRILGVKGYLMRRSIDAHVVLNLLNELWKG